MLRSPIIFFNNIARLLTSALQLGEGNATIKSGSKNPSVTALEGNKGDLYLSTSTGSLYTKTDSGTSTNWSAPGSGAGTVTSVAASVPSLLSVSGSPITTSGTLAISYSGTALPILNGGTGQTTANAALNAILPSQTSNSGKILTTDGSNTSWAAAAASGVTSVGISAPAFLSVSGSPVTTTGTLALSYSGTALPIANGGTAVTSVTTAPTASSFAGWDANSNISANNVIKGFATTVTAAGTTTLTVSSAAIQSFTGSTTQTVKLPVTSTLVLGQQFVINNNSSGIVTVQSSGSNTVQAMAANTALVCTCILTSGTTAASWAPWYSYQNANAVWN